MNIVPITRLRSELGLHEDAEPALRALLADRGLLVAHGVNGSTLREVRALLAAELAVSCGDPVCDTLAPRFGGPVVVRGASCIVCCGSVNERARKRALAACRDAGVRRIVVLGGSPRAREELYGDYVDRLPDGTSRPFGIEWRLVDGTGRPSEREALANIAWADIIVVWANTQLDHKVSTLYTNSGHRRIVTCAQRGSGALCDTLTLAVGGGPSAPRSTRGAPT